MQLFFSAGQEHQRLLEAKQGLEWVMMESKVQSFRTTQLTKTTRLPVVGAAVPEKVQGQFKTLSKRFTGFEAHLNESRNKKNDEQEAKLRDLQHQLNEQKAALMLESKNRAISMKAVQSWLTDRIDIWTQEVQAPILAK